jgi:uncharacterized protein (TIGR02599 family)
LFEYLEYTDQTPIYSLTALPGTAANSYSTAVTEFKNALHGTGGALGTLGYGQVNSNGENVVLAENIVLLVFRPRLEETDEQSLASTLGTTYSATTANSIISPGYNYDSRAWWGGCPVGASPADRILSTAYASHMRNQLPPIIDVAMVAVDPNSIVRFNNNTSAGGIAPAPPIQLQATETGSGATPIATPNAFNMNNSATTAAPLSQNMDTDLANFGAYLASNHIHYRIFRTSVQMESAAWVDN